MKNKIKTREVVLFDKKITVFDEKKRSCENSPTCASCMLGNSCCYSDVGFSPTK